MHQRETGLIAQGVEAPDLGNVDLVLRREPPGNLHRPGRYVEVERRSGPAEVGPLSHGFEVIDRLGRLDLDRSHQPVRPIGRRKHEIRKDLHRPDFDRYGLRFADVGYYLALALQAHLEESDDAVVLELLAHGADEDGAHWTSRRRRTNCLDLEGRRIIVRTCRNYILHALDVTPPALTAHVFTPQNDAVIAPAESSPTESAIRTILIVDDDRSVADTFSRMLKLEGFRVATALSAEAGLELADSVRPDAIILDMRMPITNGLQFLRVIRSKPHLTAVPVAIVTGDYFLSEPIQHELKSLGASIRFKPLWLEDLIALARTLIS